VGAAVKRLRSGDTKPCRAAPRPADSLSSSARHAALLVASLNVRVLRSANDLLSLVSPRLRGHAPHPVCAKRRLHSGQHFLSQALNDEHIGLEPVADGLWNILYYETLLGRFDEETHTITGAPSLKKKCYACPRTFCQLSSRLLTRPNHVSGCRCP